MSEEPDSPRLIFLYGPPAVGKLTVARAVAARLSGFRVLHNHVTADPVAEVLPFGTAAFWAAVERFREDLVESAAREGINLVYTFVFAPGDEPHVERIVAGYESVGGSVTFVQLVAPPEELLRRVGETGRKSHGKITDAASLQQVLRDHDVFASIPGVDSRRIDVAATSAEDAADSIVEHLDSHLGA